MGRVLGTVVARPFNCLSKLELVALIISDKRACPLSWSFSFSHSLTICRNSALSDDLGAYRPGFFLQVLYSSWPEEAKSKLMGRT